MGMNIRVAVLAIIILGLSGIGFGQHTLTSKRLRAVFLRGAAASVGSVFIQISNGTFTGNTGCNIMNGKVNLRGERITFSGLITTKRACTQTSASLESSTLSALATATRYKVISGRVKLYAGNRLVAEFQTQPKPSTATADEPEFPADQLGIEDRKWMLESIGPKAITKTENAPYMIFDTAKSSAGGDTGCNAFGGSYTVTSGSKISITEIISTMRACIEDDRMSLEGRFLDGLRSADRYAIKANKMFLYGRGKLLLTFVGQKK